MARGQSSGSNRSQSSGPERDDIRRREEISRVKEQHEQQLLGLPNVTGVFTDYKVTDGEQTDQLSIVVTVRQKKDVAAKDRVPEEINGIPTDVIEEEIQPMLAAVAVEELAPAVDATNYATLRGGISIGPCRSVYLEPPEAPSPGNYVFVGTLGCIVRDNSTDEPMMLSNFHVMCINDGWHSGDTMAQPSRVDGGSCPADVVGTLSRAVLNSSVDGAVSTISGRPHECSIVDIGDVKGTATAAVNMLVRKRGRTTELTHGKVTATDYTTNIDYGDGMGTVTLTNQIRIVNDAPASDFFGKKGDSGSVVVNDDERVVGLYFAGNSTGTVGVANPIAAVLSALDVKMCTGGIKKLEFKEGSKDIVKEVSYEGPVKRKLEFKEIEKERLKEAIKDWKEVAYEKFSAFESYQPWERVIQPVQPVQPIQPGRPVFPGLPSQPRMPSLEERLARIESLLGTSAGTQAMWEVRAEDGCLDFTGLAPGSGPNPFSAPPFDIVVFDYTGSPLPDASISTFGSYTGLNAGWGLEAKVDSRCPVIQATLVHFVQGATLEAWNADGSYAGSATMSPTQGAPQTLTIEGSAIERIRISCPQNETLLLRLCCCAGLRCAPDGGGKTSKETKEPYKELKEPIKEWKEFKEPKEFKEIREVSFPGLRPPVPGGSTDFEQRLARLEAMFPVTSHFIGQDLRPDLGRGALRREPDFGRRESRRSS